MKKLLLVIPLLLPIAQAWGSTPAGEVLYETIEAERLIINWQPTETQLGTVLVYRCETCEIVTMTFDRSTQIIRDGKELDIKILANKPNWNGHVKVSNQAPTHIVRFDILE